MKTTSKIVTDFSLCSVLIIIFVMVLQLFNQPFCKFSQFLTYIQMDHNLTQILIKRSFLHLVSIFALFSGNLFRDGACNHKKEGDLAGRPLHCLVSVEWCYFLPPRFVSHHTLSQILATEGVFGL